VNEHFVVVVVVVVVAAVAVAVAAIWLVNRVEIASDLSKSLCVGFGEGSEDLSKLPDGNSVAKVGNVAFDTEGMVPIEFRCGYGRHVKEAIQSVVYRMCLVHYKNLIHFVGFVYCGWSQVGGCCGLGLILGLGLGLVHEGK